MHRKKFPRLAAAFVVTISAGCGGATSTPPDGPNPPATGVPENPDWVPNLGSVKEGFMRGDDGKCFIQHAANPPWQEPADCETQQPLSKPELKAPEPPDSPDSPTSDTKSVEPKPPETPAKVDASNLPEAPAGWRVVKEPSGNCRAFAKSTPCPRGALCNPPPPRTVKCPSVMPKDGDDL